MSGGNGGSYWAPLHVDGLRYYRGILRKLFKSIKLPPTTHLRDFLIYAVTRRESSIGIFSRAREKRDPFFRSLF